MHNNCCQNLQMTPDKQSGGWWRGRGSGVERSGSLGLCRQSPCALAVECRALCWGAKDTDDGCGGTTSILESRAGSRERGLRSGQRSSPTWVSSVILQVKSPIGALDGWREELQTEVLTSSDSTGGLNQTNIFPFVHLCILRKSWETWRIYPTKFILKLNETWCHYNV